MRPRTLLVLLALVLGLGAFALFVDRERPSSEERAELDNKVAAVEAAEVIELRLVAEGREVLLRREPAEPPAEIAEDAEAEGTSAAAEPTWSLVEPLAAPADGERIAQLLSRLAGLTIQSRLEEPGWAALGLTEPRGRLSWRTAAGEHRLELGATVPGSSSLVARLDGGDTALVVAGDLLAELQREADYWRDHQLFRGRRSEVTALAIYPAQAPEIRLRRDEGDYEIIAPLADEADGGEADRLLDELVRLAAGRFLDEQDAAVADLGLESPWGTFELELREGEESFRIELGAEVVEGGGARYGRAGDLLFQTSADLGPWLEKAPGAWRSLDFSRYSSWQIEAGRFTDEEGGFELSRLTGDWRRDGGRVEYGPVSELMAAWAEIAAVRLANDGEVVPPAGEALLSAELTGADGARETLRIYPARETEDGTYHPARRDGRDALLFLEVSAIDAIVETTAAVRAAEIQPEADTPEGVEIEVEEGDG